MKIIPLLVPEAEPVSARQPVRPCPVMFSKIVSCACLGMTRALGVPRAPSVDAILHRPSSPATVIPEPDYLASPRVSVLIIGGGPAARTCGALRLARELLRLWAIHVRQRLPERRVGFKNLQKIGMVGIIDPNEGPVRNGTTVSRPWRLST